jgi:hypothetical protein
MESHNDIEIQTDVLSDALHRALATATGCCWLLIDPTKRPLQDEAEFDAAVLARSPTQAASPHTKLDKREMPLLLELDSARAADSGIIRTSISEGLAERLPASLTQGAGRRICGWLESSANAPTLARHIARHVVMCRPTGIMAALRWYDPAVLWALWPLLEPAQRKTLLGPVDTFWLLDPAGRWMPLRADFQGVPAAHLDLTADQWTEADAIGPLNQALRDWGAASALPEALIAARLVGAAALRRARSLGFADRRDLVAFAHYALAIHPRFDQHPLVRNRLAERADDDYFTVLVDDLKPEDWQRIRAEGGFASKPEGDRSL